MAKIFCPLVLVLPKQCLQQESQDQTSKLIELPNPKLPLSSVTH